MPACMSACGAFMAGSGDYNTDVTSGNSNAYCYLGFAALASTSPTQHCSHVVMNTAVCR